ncbi:MAG: sigma 54-interacting transcriptional regulator [Peptostreptococcaceae bacterium]|nr:sigma 54-interacting transcriptional regulator [Peptostreptococcaceae bacterium]
MKKDELLWDVATRDFILDDIDEAICVVDRNGIVTVWNKKAELIYDVPKDEIIGKAMDDVLPGTVIIDVLRSGEEQQNIYQATRTGCSTLVKAKFLYKDDEMIGVMCVDKDLSEIDELKEQVDTLKERIHYLEKQNMSDVSSAMVGNSPQMEELMYKVSKVSKSDVNMLVLGESGVGKKALGKEIHRLSKRNGMFVNVNCGAVPSGLFEEEFFGIDENGEERAGLFELADGGTLYLGDIADLPLKMQSKLLNALQNRQVSRVGSKKKIKINARIISATNKDIKEMVDKGDFLEDLYYRLNVIELNIPPLRERGSDITLLADWFLKELSGKYHVDQPSISPRVMNTLLEYDWRGNLRELKNILEHMIVMSGGKEITMDMVPYAVKERASKFSRSYAQINDLAKTVGEYEKHIIEEVLENCNWNKSQAARTLNIPRTTLMYKIELYELGRKPKKRR